MLVEDDEQARSALARQATTHRQGLAGPSARGHPAGAVARRRAQWALARATKASRAVVSYGDDGTERWLTGGSPPTCTRWSTRFSARC